MRFEGAFLYPRFVVVVATALWAVLSGVRTSKIEPAVGPVATTGYRRF
jgi:hypothetical protein